VGSIPIARSTSRCLAYPCVVLGRESAHRSVPTVPMRLQFIGRMRRSASWSRSFPTALLVRHRPRSRRAAFGQGNALGLIPISLGSWRHLGGFSVMY
jgi:hypothetical protein